MGYEIVSNTAVGGGGSWGSYDAGANAAAMGDPAMIAAVALQDPNAFGGSGVTSNDGTSVGGAWSPEPAGNNAIFDGSFSASGGLTVPQNLYASGYPTAPNPLASAMVPAGGATPDAAKAADDKPVEAKKPEPRTITVKPGDSLSAIGGREGVSWKAIYELNKDLIGSNPNLIRPGQQLKMP